MYEASRGGRRGDYKIEPGTNCKFIDFMRFKDPNNKVGPKRPVIEIDVQGLGMINLAIHPDHIDPDAPYNKKHGCWERNTLGKSSSEKIASAIDNLPEREIDNNSIISDDNVLIDPEAYMKQFESEEDEEEQLSS